MSGIESSPHSTKSFSLQHLSIQKRLPLLICILLLCVIIAFSLIAYFGLKRAALQMGKERLANLTVQVGSMFGQAGPTLLTATKTAAAQDPVKKYLSPGFAGPDTAALRILEKLRPDSTWVLTQLLDARRKPVLQSALPGSHITIDTDSLISDAGMGPDSVKIGKLSLLDSSIYYPVIATVMDQKQVVGYLVRWRIQKASTKNLNQLSQLLGNNATLYVGNKDGSLWTDMNRAVAPPPIDLKDPDNMFEYTRSQTDPVIATVQPIANTQWLVLVEISRGSILQVANRFLKWIVVMGTVLIAAGIFLAWLTSRTITRPLKKLTAAAASIAAGDYRSPVEETGSRDELGQLARTFNSMAVEIDHARQGLEKKVRLRTAELEKANKELESFSYSVSHDLRAPLRAISGYAMLLKEEYASKLDPEANRFADRIISNAKMMGQLIDDLISFSQMGRKAVKNQHVDMNMLVQTCLAELTEQVHDIDYDIKINDLPACRGDENLIKQVWMNLIGNALKYSSKQTNPRIEIGCRQQDTLNVYFVRDNGVGFDMQYAHKLFGVFERLHSHEEFEGTGVGLALVKRILNQHSGEVWAESVPGEGASFYFSLPKST